MSNIVNMPQTKTVEFGGLTLQLKLDARAILTIEQRLKKSIMSLFMSPSGGVQIPPTNELLIVLQGANKTSGVTDARIVKAFEKHIEDGKTTVDVQEIVTELLDESGFFGKEKTEEEEQTDGELAQEFNLETMNEADNSDSLL